MGFSSRPQLPRDDQILAWIEEFLARLPLASRCLLGRGYRHLSGAGSALKRALAERDPAAKDPEAFVKGSYMTGIAFKTLLVPGRPLDDPWVLDHAVELAEEALASCDRRKRKRYGDMVERGAATAIAYDALLELAGKLWSGKQIDKPRAYLRSIIWRYVDQLVSAALRQSHPGDYLRKTLIGKHSKLLAQERPDLDRIERHALAVTRAEEEVKRGWRFVSRAAEADLESIAEVDADVAEEVLGDLLIEAIDRAVEDDPFTPVDRDAWGRWKAVGFCGRDVDWSGAGCSRRAGSQRLQALFRKLLRLL